MTARRMCLVCLLVLTLGPAAAGQLQPDPTTEAERLVKQLGSPRFAEREAALKALDALGPVAVPALRRAAQGADPEIRRRVGDLIAKYERQADADAAFAPTKVRLRANSTPLGDVITDLVQQTHIQIHLAREPFDLAERTVTLNTGETSFWEALDALCRQAKVHVQSGEFYPGMPENTRTIPTAALRGLSGAEHPLILQDGAAPVSPTAFLGATRVRLLPERWDNRGRGPGEEHRWMLEMLNEPRVHWPGPPAFQLDPPAGGMANRSPQVPDNISRYRVPAVPARNGPSMAYLLGIGSTPVANVRRYEYPVYVQFPAAAGKTVPELKGALVGTAQLSAQVIALIDDVTKPGTPAAVTADGINVTVRSCRRDPDGSVALKVEVEKPQFASRPGTGRNVLSSAVSSGKLPSLPAGNALAVLNYLLEDHSTGLRLFDDHDRPYQVTALRDGIAIVQRGDALVISLNLDARQEGDAGKPRRLELIGPRLAPIEAKFTLRDVPRP